MIDVVVVGAGPAGSSLGLQLARAGYEVTLLERSRFPRTKVCGDYLCSGAVEGLRALGVAGSVLVGAHPIRSISFHGFGEHMQLLLPGDGAVSLQRAQLDARLLARARDAGASLQTGAFLRSEENGKALRISYRDEHGTERNVTSRVLAGADGAWSAVARRAGMVAQTPPPGPWAVGGELCEQPAGDELSMYIGRDGYYARNPLSATTANSMLVAAGPIRPQNAEARVRELTDNKLGFEAEKMERPVAIGPLRYRAARVMQGRVLLTGDAAELLDPFTGQGVATALQLASPATRAITSLLDGAPRASVARRYAAEWRSIVAPRRMLTRLVAALVHVGFLRRQALRSLRRDPHAVHTLLACAAGLVPAQTALAPAILLQLLAS